MAEMIAMLNGIEPPKSGRSEQMTLAAAPGKRKTVNTKHFIVNCGGRKKLKSKFKTAKTAIEAAVRTVAKPRGPKICIVQPVKVVCSKSASSRKCLKKKLMILDPILAAARTKNGVVETNRVSTRRG